LFDAASAHSAESTLSPAPPPPPPPSSPRESANIDQGPQGKTPLCFFLSCSF
jgi:hypothetical protein